MRNLLKAGLTLALLAGATASGWAKPNFAGACDGSAAIVAGKQIAVGNDENNVLRIYRPGGGSPVATLNLDSHLGTPKEADIEAGAVMEGRGYWITSHGRNSKAEQKPERMRFFATTATLPVKPVGQARRDLLAAAIADPKLAFLGLEAAAKLAPEAPGGLGIEGLAAGNGQTLLIGFRSPLVRFATGGKETAFLLPLVNPAAIVDSNAAPVFGAPIALDLRGRGVRDIMRTKAGDYRILAGSPGPEGNFALFRWSGVPGEAPRQVKLSLGDLRPEALVELNGPLLLLSDDGTDACKDAGQASQMFRGREVAQ